MGRRENTTNDVRCARLSRRHGNRRPPGGFAALFRGRGHPRPRLFVETARADALPSFGRTMVVGPGRLQDPMPLGELSELVLFLPVLVGVDDLEAVEARRKAERHDL